MRLFDLEIDGEKYKACCGLRALAILQKRYGNLSDFENKIAPKANDHDIDDESHDEDLDDDTPGKSDIDIQAVIDTAILFIKEGALATGIECPSTDAIYSASDPYGIAAQLFIIYVESLIQDNEDDEKNVENQTKHI